jgi:transcriptional regulator
MYTPASFRMEERAELLAFMRAHAFATLVSSTADGPIATHVPLVLDIRGDDLVLTGHLARQNAQAESFDGSAIHLAIFTGPHAYIPASVYENVQSVPTWNYIAVHASGPITPLTSADDRPQMDTLMHDMIDTFDKSYHAQYANLTDRYRDGMLAGIVAFELAVTRLEGKAKLSQNRNPHDQDAVEAHMLASADPAARAAGEAMRALRDTPDV